MKVPSYTNLIVGFLFIGIGYVLIGRQEILGKAVDIQTIATISGALIGGGAIFVGNQLNYWNKLTTEDKEQLELQKNLKVLLMAELVNIITPHIQQAYFYLKCERDIEEFGACAGYVFDDRYQIAEPTVYQALTPQLVALQAKEVDSIVTFYNGLQQTKQFIESLRGKQHERSRVANSALKEKIMADCESALQVVCNYAPNRKFQLPNGKTILLTELLQDPFKLK